MKKLLCCLVVAVVALIAFVAVWPEEVPGAAQAAPPLLGYRPDGSSYEIDPAMVAERPARRHVDAFGYPDGVYMNPDRHRAPPALYWAQTESRYRTWVETRQWDNEVR